MIDKLLNKLANIIANLLWTRLEIEIKKLNGVAYRNGSNRGYVEGHEDGYFSGQEDLIRRVTYLYDAVYDTAQKDALADAGAIRIEDVVDDIGEALEEAEA